MGELFKPLGDAVDDVLDAHERAGGGRFKGIRQGTYWDGNEEVWKFVSMRLDKGMLMESSFRQGLRRKAHFGMTRC